MENTSALATDAEVMEHFDFRSETIFQIAWSGLTEVEKATVRQQVSEWNALPETEKTDLRVGPSRPPLAT